MTEAAKDIAELMAAWDLIEAKAKAQFPGATDARIYEICRAAMGQALRVAV